MPTFEIICLANSRKNQGRCIAGLKTDGSGWLRPVSTLSDGRLERNNYILDNDQEPQLFDILEIECSEHRPECHQPENWVITQKKWRLVGSPNRQKLMEVLKPELDRNAILQGLFGNFSDRVEYELLQQSPTRYSLVYVKPQSINWLVQEYSGNKIYRAAFTSNNIQYDLRITDPDWESRMAQAQLSVGNYSSDEVIDRLNLEDFTADGFRFTISLGEPFVPTGYQQRYCFKMIAAVINTTQITRRLNQRGNL
jgi:hypothetical protein